MQPNLINDGIDVVEHYYGGKEPPEELVCFAVAVLPHVPRGKRERFEGIVASMIERMDPEAREELLKTGLLPHGTFKRVGSGEEPPERKAPRKEARKEARKERRDQRQREIEEARKLVAEADAEEAAKKKTGGKKAASKAK